MPVAIQREAGDGYEPHADLCAGGWDLRTQLEALEDWLADHPHALDPRHDWVADVGFRVKPGAAGGGPPVTPRLMHLCLRANLTIFLSPHGGRPADP